MRGNRWVVAVVGVVVLVVAVVVGNLLLGPSPDRSRATRSPGATSPSAVPAAPSSSSGTPVSQRAVLEVYFVGETGPGPRLFPVQRVYGVRGTESDALAQSAVNGLLRGDSGRADRTSPFPRDTRATLTRDADAVSVDLTSSGVLDARDEDDAAVALQAVVWTVDGVYGEDLPVRFTVDGSPVDVLLGQDASSPVAKDDALGTLSLVQIDEPDALTDALDSPFTVTGRAAAGEAALTWQLRRGDTVVRRGTATTRECCTFSPYSFAVRAPAGRYTLVVSDTDESGEARTTSDSIPVTVQ